MGPKRNREIIMKQLYSPEYYRIGGMRAGVEYPQDYEQNVDRLITDLVGNTDRMKLFELAELKSSLHPILIERLGVQKTTNAIIEDALLGVFNGAMMSEGNLKCAENVQRVKRYCDILSLSAINHSLLIEELMWLAATIEKVIKLNRLGKPNSHQYFAEPFDDFRMRLRDFLELPRRSQRNILNFAARLLSDGTDRREIFDLFENASLNHFCQSNESKVFKEELSREREYIVGWLRRNIAGGMTREDF